MENLEEKIMNRIQTDKIEPTSFWYFLMRDFSLWFLVFLSIVFSTLTVSPMIFILQNMETGFLMHITNNYYLEIIKSLPYMWLFLGLGSAYFAKVAWTKTKNAYKFDGSYVWIVSIILTLIFSILLNIYSGNKFAKFLDDNVYEKSFGYYKSLEARKQENWTQEKNGRFIGIVKKVTSSSFSLYNQKTNTTLEIDFKSDAPGNEFIELENKLRVVGYKSEQDKLEGPNDFTACAIFPDNFEPNKRRGRPERPEIKTETSDENCKQILAKGRASFKPGHKSETKKNPPRMNKGNDN